METRYRSQPADTNNAGVMHGGHILYHLDSTAGMTAMRHAGCNVVTAAIGHMDFLAPVHPGEYLVIKTSLNLAGRSSMEVGARLEAENPYTGESRHVARAYFTFVALGEDGRPVPVPALVPETDDDRRRMEEALKRRERDKK